MLKQLIVLQEPEELVLAAKEVLGWYSVKILKLFPYSFCWTDSSFIIEKAGRVIVQQNTYEEVVSCLEASDYEWFGRKLWDLRNMERSPLWS